MKLYLAPLFLLTIISPGCFLFKQALLVQPKQKSKHVYLYNFVISPGSSTRMPDTTYNKLQKTTVHACDWISDRANEDGVRIDFTQEWIRPIDGKNEFIFRIPTRNMAALMNFEQWLRKRVVPQKRHLHEGWEEKMLQFVLANKADTNGQFAASANQFLAQKSAETENEIHLFMVYVMRARTRSILGYYQYPYVVIGKMTSEVIAHEILHSLGAHDIYIHSAWIGKRKQIVKRDMRAEIMNGSIRKQQNCSYYFISDYSRYCMGWRDTLPEKHIPLLKENYMARWLFEHGLKKQY